MTRGNQHLRSLTSLRFFAAAAVVIYHATIWSAAERDPDVPLLRFGFVGVSFFFVLSGFVLVRAAFDEDTVGGFYRRRLARVWPLHAFTWLIALGLAAFGLTEVGVGSGLTNLLLVHTWSTDFSVIYGFNGVSWSLSDEAFFYAVFPLLLVLARRVGPLPTIAAGMAWMVVGGVAGEVIGKVAYAYSLPAYRVGEFAFGMGLALLVGRRDVPRARPRVALALLAASYLAVVALDRGMSSTLFPHLWVPGVALLPAIGLVLVAFARRDLAGHEGWLTQPLLVRLGQWSFALYMLHELVFRVARPVMVDHRWTAPLFALMCVALAGAVYEWIEKPLERRLRGAGRPAVQLEPSSS